MDHAATIKDWLETVPVRDDPHWSAAKPAPSWPAWVATGRAIPDVDQELVRMLAKEPDPVWRARAAAALGHVGDAHAVAPLSAALADIPSVAAEAAGALGRLGRLEGVDPLCRLLASRADANARASAASALAGIGGANARACLLAARGDSDPFVRQAVTDALGRVGP